MCALSRSPARAPSQSSMPLAPRTGRSNAPQDTVGNGFLQEQLGQVESEPESMLLADDEEQGPIGGLAGAALAAAFGRPLHGVTVDQGNTAALGADATTEGTAITLSSGIDAQDAADPASMEVLAHEAAHALAGGGSGEELVDAPGDAGEAKADAAGKAFRRWSETGFEGPAPKLEPAAGGKAAIHRHPTSPAPTELDGSLYLKRGSSGAAVVLLQQLLAKAGQWVSADGDFGGITQKAVVAFQKAQRLGADGVVGPKTAEALNRAVSTPAAAPAPQAPAPAADPNAVYRLGSKGGEVKEIQRLLVDKGAHIVVDGDFGAQTQNAVMGFQRANGLQTDGVVGPDTRNRLRDPASKDITGAPTQSGGAQQPSAMRDRVLNAAAGHLGARYYWGADGPGMFDCSGFILYVLRQDTGLVQWGDDNAAGIKNRLPRANSPQKGDLVFYSGSSGVEHMEMYTGSGSTEIGCSGGGSHTFGDDPHAKVQYGDMNADGRSRSYGSIQPLIDAKS